MFFLTFRLKHKGMPAPLTTSHTESRHPHPVSFYKSSLCPLQTFSEFTHLEAVLSQAQVIQVGSFERCGMDEGGDG